MSTRGFTLIELVVALAVGGMMVLLAHRTFTVASELGLRVAGRRETHDRDMNARRFLAQAFGSLEMGTGGGGFHGRQAEARFATWLPDSAGRPSLVRVLLVSRQDSVLIQLDSTASNTPEAVHLFPDAKALALDYLLDFGADAVWVREWDSPVSAPLAVRLRLGRPAAADTLLFLIGPRG